MRLCTICSLRLIPPEKVLTGEKMSPSVPQPLAPRLLLPAPRHGRVRRAEGIEPIEDRVTPQVLLGGKIRRSRFGLWKMMLALRCATAPLADVMAVQDHALRDRESVVVRTESIVVLPTPFGPRSAKSRRAMLRTRRRLPRSPSRSRNVLRGRGPRESRPSPDQQDRPRPSPLLSR